MPTLKNFHRRHHQDALRMLWQKFSYEEIAARFGVKRDTIYRLAKLHGADGLASGKKVRHPMLGCRISHDELEAFEALAKNHGYRSKSELLRALIRGASGMLEVTKENADILHGLKVSFSRIGSNINQIARGVNRGQFSMTDIQMKELQELRSIAFRAQRDVEKFVNEARRGSVKAWKESEYGPEAS